MHVRPARTPLDTRLWASSTIVSRTRLRCACLVRCTLGARKAEKAEEKAQAKAAAKAAIMKRPAAADESIGKKAKTVDGFPPPTWYDAQSRHHILFKTGYVGKGSTKTLTYHSDAEKADRIKQAEVLVKDPPPLCQMQYIFECSLKFQTLEILILWSSNETLSTAIVFYRDGCMQEERKRRGLD